MTSKMRKLTVFTLILGLSVVSFGGLAAAEKITLNFMADSRSEFVKMQKLLPGFTKETGISVNMVALQETPLRAKTGLELSAPSTDINIIMTDFQLMKKYASARVLAPMDDLLKGSSFDPANFQAPFLDALKYDGKLFGLPLYQDCNILMYRADIYAELGLNVPVTVDDLMANAKAITEWGKDKGVYGIALRGQRGMGVNEWTWPTFLWAYGGSYYKDFPKDMHPALDSPEALTALKYYVKMIREYAPPGAANYSYVEVQTDLMQGKAAMIIDSATLGVRAEDPAASKVAGKLGYAVVPKGPGGQQPGFYTWTVVIPAKAKHKEAAAKFLAWLLDPEIAPKVGWSAPDQALEQVYNVPPYKGYDQAQPLIKVMKDSLALADPDYRPRVPEQTEVGTQVSIAISDAIAGTKTPEQALKDANEAIDKIMKKAKYYK
jgi:ABC-type glycerol-3-phosphate transport system substrate-binding protein